MTIQKRIIILTLIFVGLFIAALATFDANERTRAALILAGLQDSKQHDFATVTNIKSAPLQSFSEDYTFWDEMVSFVSTRDLNFAHENIDTGLTTFNADAAWVYKPNDKLVYSVYPDHPELANVVFDPAMFKLLHDEREDHFFVLSSKGPVEIWAATIHPTTDTESATEPKGFFLVGRVWDDKYLAELGRLIDGKVTQTSDVARPSNNNLDMVWFSKDLKDWQRANIAHIAVAVKPVFLTQLQASRRFTLIWIFVVGLVVLLIVIFGLTRWVNRPLSLLTQSLATASPDALDKLRYERTEFGKLATLVGEFYKTENLLEGKVEKQTTKLREALAKSEREKAQDEALLSGLGEGVVGATKDGVIFFMNQQFEKISGYTHQFAVGKSYVKIVNLVDERGNQVASKSRPFFAAIETRRVASSEAYFLVTKTGENIPVAINASPIILNDKVTGAVAVFRDLSKELAADQLKAEFVSLASHQLRTPATVVKGFLSMLMEGYAGKPTKAQLNLIKASYDENNRELKLVNAMLDVAQIEAGGFVLQMDKVDMGALLQSVADLESQIAGIHEHKLIYNAPKKPIYLHADEEKLRMVVTNLIDNAIKYTPNGGKIELKLGETAKFVTVEVSDNGIGIAPKDHQLLFKRFSRAPRPRRIRSEGAGLGLYLVKKIVMLHNGTVGVTSAIGKGATFTIQLPRDNRDKHQEGE